MAEPPPQSPSADAQPITNGLATDAPAASATPADVTMAGSHEVSRQRAQGERKFNSTQLEPTAAAQPTPEPQAHADVEPTTAPTGTSTSASTPAPAPAPTPTPAPAPAPSSRASPHPSAPAMQQSPVHPVPHGSPTRVYLNQHVTPHLLEAMKHLVTAEPEKPLLWLSEFLAGKSREIEG